VGWLTPGYSISAALEISRGDQIMAGQFAVEGLAGEQFRYAVIN
jgi:hypothetical protein